MDPELLPGDTNIEGWLLKRGFYNTSFKRRYCRLVDNILSYYADEVNPEPNGSIDVCKAELFNDRKFLTKLEDAESFRLRTTANRTFYFKGESAKDTKTWTKAIENVKQKQRMMRELMLENKILQEQHEKSEREWSEERSLMLEKIIGLERQLNDLKIEIVKRIDVLSTKSLESLDDKDGNSKGANGRIADETPDLMAHFKKISMESKTEQKPSGSAKSESKANADRSIGTNAFEGSFSLIPELGNPKDLQRGNTLRFESGVDTKGCASVSVNLRRYRIQIADLKPDFASHGEIMHRLKQMPTFPSEEVRRASLDYPKNMPVSTILVAAAKLNDVFALKHAIAHGADPDSNLGDGNTPLILVLKTYMDVVRMNAVSDIESKSTALCHNSSQRQPEVRVDYFTDALTPEYHNYRKVNANDGLACAIILLVAGADLPSNLWENVNGNATYDRRSCEDGQCRMKKIFDYFRAIRSKKKPDSSEDSSSPAPELTTIDWTSALARLRVGSKESWPM